MPQSAGAVVVGVTGDVYTAALATPLPSDTDTALNAAFLSVGYLSEDGIVTSRPQDYTDIKAWQNGAIVRKVKTSDDYTIQFSMMETNEKTLQVYYGNFTAGPTTASGVVSVGGTAADYRGAWVFDVLDTGGSGDGQIRIVVTDGQVTERGDVSYVNGDATMYPVTVTAYPDSSGYKAYIYYEAGGAS
jgi:hypothetical protein